MSLLLQQSQSYFNVPQHCLVATRYCTPWEFQSKLLSSWVSCHMSRSGWLKPSKKSTWHGKWFNVSAETCPGTTIVLQDSISSLEGQCWRTPHSHYCMCFLLIPLRTFCTHGSMKCKIIIVDAWNEGILDTWHFLFLQKWNAKCPVQVSNLICLHVLPKHTNHVLRNSVTYVDNIIGVLHVSSVMGSSDWTL